MKVVRGLVLGTRWVAVRFAVVSLVPILALGWFLNSTVRHTIEQRAAGVYGDMTSVMFRMASNILVQPNDFAASRPLPSDRAGMVDALITQVGAAPGQVRVRLVTPSRYVIYGNHPSDAGSTAVSSAPLDSALSGRTATRFIRGAVVDDAGPTSNLIEIYMPLRFGTDAHVYGAIVVSGIDATVVDAINGDVRRMQTSLAIGLGALWLALLPIASSVSRSLRRQSAANERLAMHDTLTGLPNRNLLSERLARAIMGTDRTSEPVGLLLIDLDRFKEVNDTLGHGAGDRLLECVAARLLNSVRPQDTVARLGGDEFAVVVPGLHTPSDLADLAARIARSLNGAIAFDDIEVAVRASIGGAVYPAFAHDGEQLLQHADIAMYAAKAAQETYVEYRDELDSHSVSRLALAADFTRAIAADDQLILHFQPVASPLTGEVEAMEALVRWQHPVLGLLAPIDFIPMAEQSGMIGLMRSRVLDLALCQTRVWRDQGFDLSMAVNLSAADLRSVTVRDEVAALLVKYDLPASRVELEVTETALLSSPDAAVELVASLRALGVRIALDDFGTGYSSLTYLQRLRPHRLKVDRSFVEAMTREATDAKIVQSLIDLAHSLEIGVTAEGVETNEQWQLLGHLGCDLVQGYYLARPMDIQVATAWLRERRHQAGRGDSYQAAL